MREEWGLPLSFLFCAPLPSPLINSCRLEDPFDPFPFTPPLLRNCQSLPIRPPLPRDCRLPPTLLCSDIRFPEIASGTLSSYPLSNIRAISLSSPRPSRGLRSPENMHPSSTRSFWRVKTWSFLECRNFLRLAFSELSALQRPLCIFNTFLVGFGQILRIFLLAFSFDYAVFPTAQRFTAPVPIWQ